MKREVCCESQEVRDARRMIQRRHRLGTLSHTCWLVSFTRSFSFLFCMRDEWGYGCVYTVQRNFIPNVLKRHGIRMNCHLTDCNMQLGQCRILSRKADVAFYTLRVGTIVSMQESLFATECTAFCKRLWMNIVILSREIRFKSSHGADFFPFIVCDRLDG